MDIRVVGDSIFEIQSDCVLYFIDNSFSGVDCKDLIYNSGKRMIEVLSKISSISNYEYKIIPAFDIKSLYVALMTFPEKIVDDIDKNIFFESLEKLFLIFKNRDFRKISIDIKRFENAYGKDHTELFKSFLKKMQNSGEDFVIFICK